MQQKPDDLQAFLKAVKRNRLDEDLSKAARHHSAVNVAEANKIIDDLAWKPSS